MTTPTFGFIITRHVNSETTNKYWNNSVKLLRTFYPFIKIVIIDDDSNYDFVKAEFDYQNVELIQSEFPKRGELLPYYYYLKQKFFENAVIIHDSVFFHKRINFEKLNKVFNVLPLWHFNADKENLENTKRIVYNLKNNVEIAINISNSAEFILMPTNNKWNGCFGVQSYINLKFLERIEIKYEITRLIQAVQCRADRCCLERIFGYIFFNESSSSSTKNIKSLLGDIHQYQTWGYTYDTYLKDRQKKFIPKNIVKVWTGR